jgi:hypothetical protein
MPSNPVFFPDMGAKWASLSAWLPLFSVIGVIAYCLGRRREFVKRMLIISMFMAVIPVLNSAFVLFNGSYYARWYHMPILLMCVATADVLEHREQLAHEVRRAYRWTAGIVLAIILAVGFSPVLDDKDKTLSFGLYGEPGRFWFMAVTAAVCLVLAAVVLFGWGRSSHFFGIALGTLCFVIVVFSMGHIISGKSTKAYDDWFAKVPLQADKQLKLPDGPFARSDLYECMDNMGMLMACRTFRRFILVPASIMEFLSAVHQRDFSSKPPVIHGAAPAAFRALLFIETNNKEQAPMPGFYVLHSQKGLITRKRSATCRWALPTAKPAGNSDGRVWRRAEVAICSALCSLTTRRMFATPYSDNCGKGGFLPAFAGEP